MGRISMGSEIRAYYFVLAFFLLAVVLANHLRKARTGRSIVAVRDNEPAAATYGVSSTGAKLIGFAISGFLASMAGGLLLIHQQGFDTGLFDPQQSLSVFSMVVIGGLGSVPGAVLGALFIKGVGFLTNIPRIQLLVTGVGLLAVLWVFPEGLGGALYRVRDRLLVMVARRSGLQPEAEETSQPNTKSPSPSPQRLSDQAKPDASSVAAEVPPLLRVEGVTASYGAVQVLFGVDLEVHSGEIVALLGVNGAGKSTVLKTICGLLPTTSGSICCDEMSLTAMKAHKISRNGVSQMPGGKGVFGGLTVRENLELAHLSGKDQPDTSHPGANNEHHAAVRRALERFPELRTRLGDSAGNLSGGQQQMLALAMAMLTKPKLLLIDELSLGLAPAVVARLLDTTKELAQEGTAIVIVEQSINVALELADRAYFLEKGEVRYSGQASQLLEHPELLRSIFLANSLEPTSPTAAKPLPTDKVETHVVTNKATPDTGFKTPATSSTQCPLRCSGLSISFGGLRALSDVTFDLKETESLGFLGANGAGKTTLFNVISGLLPVTAGSIQLFGTELTGLGIHQRARMGLGRSFQDARLFSSLTVAETISVALQRWAPVQDPLAEILGLPDALASQDALDARVEELIDLMSLGQYTNNWLGELSTGTRRIVDLACIVAHQPKVLLLDEPSSGIAQREVEALGQLLSQLRDTLNLSILLIEHDMPLLQQSVDRVIALDLGSVIAEGTPAEVFADPLVLAAYMGDNQTTIKRSGSAT